MNRNTLNDSEEKGFNDDIEIFLAIEKEKISIAKNISRHHSRIILDKVKEYKSRLQVNWKKVMNHFECIDGSNQQLEKKIRDHYYNKTAKLKRKSQIRENYKKKLKIPDFLV